MAWLVVTGYMGAGKSTVGAAVAARLGVRFVDLDDEIAARSEMTIPQIFARKGELWFRRTEERVVRELLAEEPPGVLALGGGALESTKTRGLLARSPAVVWLRPSTDVAWGRVRGSDRPLAPDRDRFARRAASREAGYREASDIEIDADAPFADVVERVLAFASQHTVGATG